MWLEKIEILNYKNHETAKLEFSEQINAFVGSNGSGKTNLLDAIYYLSLTKSAFSTDEQQNIRHTAPFFMLKGDFVLENKNYQIQFSFQPGQKKKARNNKRLYDKLSEHIGQFPVVLIAPNDTDIIRDGSDIRRKFFDGIISQIDKPYLENLLQYNHILRQRNSLLKQFAERNYFDADLLETYNEPLLDVGQKIYETRKVFLTDFHPHFHVHYQNLSAQKETVNIQYQSDLEEQHFESAFRKNLPKDRTLQRTTLGIHKDDFIFEINGQPLKKFGSQGQQKSFVIALKLAQFDIIKHQKKIKPILLLDDIFDKLDDLRIQKLTEMVINQSFGQLFVTDARPERTASIFDQVNANKKVFHIEGGQVVSTQESAKPDEKQKRSTTPQSK